MSLRISRTHTRNPVSTTLQIRNFKGIGFAEVELNGLTVLLGANSAGKSSISQALILLNSAQSEMRSSTPLNMPEMSLGGFSDVLKSDAIEDYFQLGLLDRFEKTERHQTDGLLSIRFGETPLSSTFARLVSKREDFEGLVLISLNLESTSSSPRSLDLPFSRIFVELTSSAEGQKRFKELRIDLAESSAEANSIHRLLNHDDSLEEILRALILDVSRERIATEDKKIPSENLPAAQFRKQFLSEVSDIADEVMSLDEATALQEILENEIWSVESVDGQPTIPTQGVSLLKLRKSQKIRNLVRNLLIEQKTIVRTLQTATSYLEGLQDFWISGSDYISRQTQINLAYLGPLRSRSLSATHLEHSSTSLSPLGVDGRMLARVLHEEFNNPKQASKKFKSTSGHTSSLKAALEDWLKFFRMPPHIKLENNEFGHVVKVGEGKKSHFRRVDEYGTGLSQLLPVLALTLIAEKDSWVIIEQPELHLHPLAQRRLADFFMVLSSERKLLIETHSEYLITRLRRNAAMGALEVGKLPAPSVYFVEQDAKVGSKVTRAEIDSSGSDYDWPESFSDFGEQDKLDIFEASEQA